MLMIGEPVPFFLWREVEIALYSRIGFDLCHYLLFFSFQFFRRHSLQVCLGDRQGTGAGACAGAVCFRPCAAPTNRRSVRPCGPSMTPTPHRNRAGASDSATTALRVPTGPANAV